MAATPATRALDDAGIRYELTEYEPGEGGFGDALVAATGLGADAAAKTLVAELDDGRRIVAVVPIASTLDLKALARAAGTKRATMADPADAERRTGYVVGGISPLGHRSRLAVFVDASLCELDVVHVSGGRRGLELSLSPHDLVSATGAEVAPLAR